MHPPPPPYLNSVASATLASGDVDLCLVPESDIVLDGPRGCLPHIMKRVWNGRETRVSMHSAADKDKDKDVLYCRPVLFRS